MKKLESFEIQNGGKEIKINDLDLSDYPITKLEAEAKFGYLEMHIDFKFRLASADPVLYKASIERDQEEIQRLHPALYLCRKSIRRTGKKNRHGRIRVCRA